MKRWEDNCDAVTPIFKFSQDVHKVIYTTNTIESLNSIYKKLNRQRNVFPNDTVLLKPYTYLRCKLRRNGISLYILESLSKDSNVTTIKDLYKIGVTTGSVSNRIKNARKDPIYLMAPVKIVEDFRLTGSYNPQKS